MNRFTLRVCAVVAALLLPVTGFAQDGWPSKPIQVVLSGAPGSSSDVLLRTIFEPVSEKLGVPIVPEYKPGAGTTLAGGFAARQPADGSSFFLASVAPLAIGPRIYTNAEYDPVTDFAGVARLVTTQNILFVNANVPVKTVAELVALAKAEPGKYNVGIGAGGSSFHMATVLFMKRAGIELFPIIYNNNALSLQAVLAGEVETSFDNLINVIPHIRSGAVRPLAVSSSQRDPQLPDVPTMMEAGIEDYDVTSWFGLVAPVGTPSAIVDRMSAEVADALRDPRIVEVIEGLGNKVDYQTPGEFDAFFKSENARWKPIVEESGVQAP